MAAGGTTLDIAADDFTYLDLSQIPTRFEQTNPRFRWLGTWTTSYSPAYSGGSSRSTYRSGSAVTITFIGTSLDWIASQARNFGQASVSLDGGTAFLVDLYSPTALYKQKVWGTGLLPAQTHTVKIHWSGQRNPLATGTYVNVDAVDVLGVLQ